MKSTFYGMVFVTLYPESRKNMHGSVLFYLMSYSSAKERCLKLTNVAFYLITFSLINFALIKFNFLNGKI